jgi:hypothetical protein
VNTVSTLGSPQCPDPLVSTSTEAASAHGELLSICERLAAIWSERARSELELWKALKQKLGETSTIEEALGTYSESTAQRMCMALENAQRIFEEQQEIVARFSRPPS